MTPSGGQTSRATVVTTPRCHPKRCRRSHRAVPPPTSGLISRRSSPSPTGPPAQRSSASRLHRPCAYAGFVLNPTPEEVRQLAELRARVHRDYPAETVDDINAAVDQGIAELRDAKIRNFVPILVERSVHRQLGRRQTDPTDTHQ